MKTTDIEAGTGSITLTRIPGSGEVMRAYRVVVDGEEIGRIDDGDLKGFPLGPGLHELRVKIDWAGSLPVRFELLPGQSLHFVCGSNMRGLRSLFLPLYLLFLRNRWLWVRPGAE